MLAALSTPGNGTSEKKVTPSPNRALCTEPGMPAASAKFFSTGETCSYARQSGSRSA